MGVGSYSGTSGRKRDMIVVLFVCDSVSLFVAHFFSIFSIHLLICADVFVAYSTGG